MFIRETKVFLGSENPLVVHRKYTVEFTCDFLLGDYPFDTQNCAMTFQLKKTTAEEATLRIGAVTYTGPDALIEYKVMNISATGDYLCGRWCHSSIVLSERFYTGKKM